MNKTILLNNGVKIPRIGFGVFRVPKGKMTQDTVMSALKLGYRLIDTAALYGNEKDVGLAIKRSKVSRNKLFVTTKLHPLRFFNIERGFYKSMKNLGVDYVDLYLIHWPFLRKKAIWNVLEKIYARGHIRAIGVSNYGMKDLQDLLLTGNIVPAVNQIEVHPFFVQEKLTRFCKANNIIIEAHSPLTHGKRLFEGKITTISNKYKKSNAQILLRWSLQKGNVIIPKAQSIQHLKENLNVFDFKISAEDMRKLDSLNENNYIAFLSRFSRNK